ncbi:MAG: type I-B CRISPR-associated endonuclease Cas1b [Ignavibacteriaceae bacterium]
MKQSIYLFSDSLIRRKDSTILVERICRDESADEEADYELETKLQEELLLGEEIIMPAGDKKYIPVENIESVFTFGSVHFNTRFLYFLSQSQIPMHIFNYNGDYAGTFYPAETNLSGNTLINQVSFYKHQIKRLDIAKQFVSGSISNGLANLKYHLNRGARLNDFIEQIVEIRSYIHDAQSVEELMGLEGAAKKVYYTAWRYIFSYPIDFTQRVKNPPNNLINALISYGNMIVYSVCANEIYHTKLYPEIGFLHQPGEGRSSLSFDIADIFKPLITDRAIFKLINKNVISEKDAVVKNGKCYLKKKTRQAFAEEIQEKLITKIQLDGKEVRYTYRRVIREECYKLIKHINGEETYKPYISKW